MNLKESYKVKVLKLAELISMRKRRSRWFVLLEIIGALGVISALVCVCYFGFANWQVVLCVLSALVWIVVTRIDVKNGNAIELLEAQSSVYENEIQYLDGTFPFDDGEEYIDSSHEFSYDLDVFGKNSLFNRICRCVTSGGKNFLAGCLKNLKWDAERPAAVAELADKEQFLATFKTHRYINKGVIDSVKTVDVIQQLSDFKISKSYTGVIPLVIAWMAIIGLIVSIALAAFDVVPPSVPTLWGASQFFVVFSICSGKIKQMSKISDRLYSCLVGYYRIVTLIESENFTDSKLQKLKDRLTGAEDSFAKLKSFLKGIDSRSNISGLILFNTFMLSDFFLIRRFYKWQQLYSGKMYEWVDIVSEVDALVSMATMKYNNPEACDATVVDSDDVVFEAKGLVHPFLGKDGKTNDFSIKNKNFYIITGANMAGKSTFLRALGVNYILAINAMPVFADNFVVSRFKVFSSMRTQDDLTHGISYFNAELLRLKQLIHYCDAPSEENGGRPMPTLIILDEILKGTNSMDKLNGSRLFLAAMVKKNVTGVIATHDLELSKMEDESPDTFHNYCFEIKVGDSVVYDYKISNGVARNQNATYLLKRVLEEC